MGVGHGAPRVFLRAAGRPANHFGGEILEASGWHLVVGFLDRGFAFRRGSAMTRSIKSSTTVAML
jgi:hypothetical protein